MSLEKIYGKEVLDRAVKSAEQGICPRNHFGLLIDPEIADQRDACGVEELAREIAKRAGVTEFKHPLPATQSDDPLIMRLIVHFPGSVLLT